MGGRIKCRVIVAQNGLEVIRVEIGAGSNLRFMGPTLGFRGWSVNSPIKERLANIAQR